MVKIKKILIKMATIISLLILNFLGILNSVQAVNLENVEIYAANDCGRLLIYKDMEVITYYAEYNYNGVTYPAYCLDKTKTGVGSHISSYTVSVNEAIKDVELWKYIVNGYPYKTYQELGCANKEEAFAATKQAIYCYLHGNNVNDYTGIGEAGQRTLNALKTIVANAQNSNETKCSNQITINKNIESWKQDEIEKNYVSKTYSISADTSIKNYTISLTGENIADIKITDIQNEEKQEFSSGENFKILVPIKNLTQNIDFNINVQTQIATKPVLYGLAPNSSYQDYALTCAIYEDGSGTAKDECFKNDTKIKIVKQDNETKEAIEGVEFELLNENKEQVYAGLKSDENGEILLENIIPGKYYIREVKAVDGYILYENLIEVNCKLNESVTVKVNNQKEAEIIPNSYESELEVTEEVPVVEKTKEVSKESVTLKRLPVTGM